VLGRGKDGSGVVWIGPVRVGSVWLSSVGRCGVRTGPECSGKVRDSKESGMDVDWKCRVRWAVVR